MDRFAPHPAVADVSAAIVEAPGWARVGITMPDAHLRERAIAELARTIVDRLAGPTSFDDGSQLLLEF